MYVHYLQGEKKNKFSTKVENNDHFATTRDILKAELSFFHYKTRVDQVILDCPMRYYTIHALIFIYSETSI